jgi:hypothetical protein
MGFRHPQPDYPRGLSPVLLLVATLIVFVMIGVLIWAVGSI